MHYLSLDTIIYRPVGGEDLVLCQYDDVMAQLVEVKPSVQVQREAVIGSPWMLQGGRGNGALQMTFTVVRAFKGGTRLYLPSADGKPTASELSDDDRVLTRGEVVDLVEGLLASRGIE